MFIYLVEVDQLPEEVHHGWDGKGIDYDLKKGNKINILFK